VQKRYGQEQRRCDRLRSRYQSRWRLCRAAAINASYRPPNPNTLSLINAVTAPGRPVLARRRIRFQLRRGDVSCDQDKIERTISALAVIQGASVRVVDRETRRLGQTLEKSLEPHKAEIAAFADKGSMGLPRFRGEMRSWDQGI
jgi:hypothetical protein